MNRKLTNFFILLCAALGCIVSLVLVYKHFFPQASIGCTVSGGCESVTESRYGHLGPIPTSIIGLGMYLTFAGLCLRRKKSLDVLRDAETRQALAYATSAAETPDSPEETTESRYESPVPPPDLAARPRAAVRRLDTGVWFIALAAFGISWWLQYNALFQIQSFCPWCLTSAFLVTIIFLLASRDYWLEGRVMTGEQKMLAGVSVFLFVLLGVMYGPTVSQQFNLIKNGPPPIVPTAGMTYETIAPQDMHVTGDPKAPVLIVEFADYQCPACKQASEEAAKILKTRGKDFRLAFRNFPLPIPEHHWNRQAAAAAEAAGLQGKFWEMHDLLYQNQKQMAEADFEPARFEDYARDLGLNMTKFHNDCKTKEVLGRIETDVRAGQTAGLNMTPFFIIIHGRDMESIAGQQKLLARLSNANDPIWRPAETKSTAPPLATGAAPQGK